MANPLYDRLFGAHAGKTTPFLHLPDGRVISHQQFLETAAQIANVLVQTGCSRATGLPPRSKNPPKRWRSMPPVRRPG